MSQHSRWTNISALLLFWSSLQSMQPVLFTPCPALFTSSKVVTPFHELYVTVSYLVDYFHSAQTKAQQENCVIPLVDRYRTALFIKQILEEDKATNNFRLQDPMFLEQHFICVRWNGDKEAAIKDKISVPLSNGHIRLTNYCVFQAEGSYTKTELHTCALYNIPQDEQLLTEKEIEQRKASLIRFKYTKQEIIAGALDTNPLVKPLVWLTREGLEEALMQGTIIVVMPDGTKKVFNVDKNNGIAYDRTLKDRQAQKRYWYFKESPSMHGQLKIPLIPFVQCAGNIQALGAGAFIALEYTNPLSKQQELLFTFLTDTGGAFVNNLYQLDLFIGFFRNRAEYNAYIKTRGIPATAQAYILVKK